MHSSLYSDVLLNVCAMIKYGNHCSKLLFRLRLAKSMVQGHLWKVRKFTWSRYSLFLWKEPEVSSFCSQKSMIGSSSEPVEGGPYLYALFCKGPF